MRDGRLQLQEAIKTLVDAEGSTTLYVDLASCTSLPYTLWASDTLVQGPDKDNGNNITFTLNTWAATLTAARTQADGIIQTLTESTYTIDSPFRVEAAALDFAGEPIHEPLPNGSHAYGCPIRIRYTLAY